MTSRWAKWGPEIAAVWALGFAAVHAWWAVAGAPRFAPPGESFFPGGWVPVVLSLVAAVVAMLIGSGAGRDRDPRRRWLLAGAGWLAGAGMIAYSFMFWASVVGVLFGLRVSWVDWTTLLARGSGVACGVLTVAVAIAEQRRARGACPRCGRVHGRPRQRRTDPTPRWAYVAGYLAIAGCLSRFGAEILYGLTSGKGLSEVLTGPASVLAILLFLAGTLLPLALTHRWGRIWPRWVVPLAGRAVLRWIVLGPGLFMGAGFTGYFGIGAMIAWAADANMDGRPLWWTVMVLPGYTVWGLGLLGAAISYFNLTKPECRSRGPVVPTAFADLSRTSAPA
jgi:hypothetical protein